MRRNRSHRRAKLPKSAKAEPATLEAVATTARAGSWFADWIAKHELPKIAGSLRRTMRVRTTLEPEMQRLAERIVNEALAAPATREVPAKRRWSPCGPTAR